MRGFAFYAILRLWESGGLIGRLQYVQDPVSKGGALVFGRRSCYLSQLLILLLAVLPVLSGCLSKPSRVHPVVSQSLSTNIQAAHPNAEIFFALGPFGGELGAETLTEAHLDGDVLLTGREFLQQKADEKRLLSFLSHPSRHSSFLTTLAFPHHNPQFDTVQAQKTGLECLNGNLPAMRLCLKQDSPCQNAWLTVLSYPLQHPALAKRLIWLIAAGPEDKAKTTLTQLASQPSLQKGLLAFETDPLHHALLKDACQP